MGLYTESCLKVLARAETEARSFEQSAIGIEHLLLALLSEESGIAHEILDLYIERNELILAIESRMEEYEIKPDENMPGMTVPLPLRQIPLNILLKAKKDSPSEIGTENLLDSLLCMADGVRTPKPKSFSELLTISSKEKSDKEEGRLEINPGRIFWKLQIDIKLIRLELATRLNSQLELQAVKTAPLPPDLLEFGICLTDLAIQGKLAPVIGRDEETRRIIRILSRRSKNNPIIIGEPGVGKTAVVEGFALRIANKTVPESMCKKIIYSLNMGTMLAGTQYRGQFEARLKTIVDNIRANPDIILFIDEVHQVVAAGSSSGGLDAANFLKPALARGELSCVGATTRDEYRTHIESDPALARRFQPVFVDEPSVKDTVTLLKEIRDYYEDYHDVKITNKAIDASASLSDRYVSERFLPDKAIDLMDEAGARVAIANEEEQLEILEDLPEDAPEIEEFWNGLYDIRNAKYLAAAMDDFLEAEAAVQAERALYNHIITMQRYKNCDRYLVYEPSVLPEDVAHVVSSWTNIPVNQLTEEEATRVLGLEKNLRSRVIGQEEAILAVSRSVRRARSGIRNPNRPIACLLFAGPTGVGKTELTKALAALFYGHEDSMVRFDMSEYMERHTVSKLIGAPPGYVGYQEGGLLTDVVRRRPYSLLLFDEIEKAHPEVYNLMLQIFEDGRLTDSQGNVVNFKNTLIVMTSNLGSQACLDSAPSVESIEPLVGPGVNPYTLTTYEMKRILVTEALKQFFRPEFLNRLDEIIVFRSLTITDVELIAGLMLASLKKRLLEQELHFYWDQSVVEYLLVSGGYDPKYGARPMRRAIERIVETRITSDIVQGFLKPEASFWAFYSKEKKHLYLAYEDTPDELAEPARW
jgi:ATP-dependent Clp protease ATP-binding subunit ClpC